MPALIGTTLALGAAGFAALGGTVTWAWRRSGLGSSRRRARRAVRPLAAEARRYDKAVQRWEKRVEPAARSFAEAQQEQRLREVPIETLREAGASNVRWSALREAGYQTLADVHGLPPKALALVHGVGKTSGGRVAAAARELARRVRAEPPHLPDPGLKETGAPDLAARTLELADALDAGGEDARQLEAFASDLTDRLATVRRETSISRWISGLWNRQRVADSIANADRLTEHAQRLEREGLLERAAAGRKRLARFRRTKRTREEVRQQFQERYARCCALLQQVLGKVTAGDAVTIARGKGGLSADVARRVERFSLHRAGMRAVLRRYQEFGAKYLLVQERTILGDEMGLGKTMQALAAMSHCWQEDPGARFFVVAPAGLLLHWIREIERHTSLRGFLLHGEQLEDNLRTWGREGGVAVTSYATLRNLDLGRSLAATGGTIALCVVDEAHYAKNPQAGRTQALIRLLQCSTRACLMSGTPMENHPGEFLNLIEAIRPSDAAELRSGELQLDAAAGSVRAFHRAVAKVYLRRNQEDVLTELPEKIEVQEWVELSTEERRRYHEHVLAGNFMGMRQAATAGSSTESAKLDHLDELLEDHRASGRKVLVFSYFLRVLDAVAARFEFAGIIRGGVPPQERQDLCDRFQAMDGHALLLLQITAGGQGLNLQQASAVVLMEPQTKPSSEAQAIARAHRMGQTNRVIVHRLLARETCDESLVNLLAEKEQLFDTYARQSLVKDASGQATETNLAKAVIEAEQARLSEQAQPENPV